MWKAVLFDLDGTLADTLKSLHYCTNRALKYCGLPGHPMEAYKTMVGDGAAKLLERALIAAGDTQLVNMEKITAKYKEVFAKDCMYEVKPYDGILELLGTLKERGIKIAVLSNKPHAQTIDVVETLFGKGYFDHVQGQQEGIRRKPYPDGALAIAAGFGIEPAECLYLGDTNTDMQTGNAAGMHTVGVTWGFRDREELEANQAQDIIDAPMELCRLL
ncbi:HAD family hydrolase [Diplocloster agilis]|uniref:HAD family hydrolase n=1 Tax=Diplocloster agilis TaxID=2850323 RepID=A0A949K905_9FIRM|nr:MULTISPECIES: HAD family hydrolase [Lachnospiraceae]MBU9739027.1 HAD family hydrolase [Diplocloster agilis]MBU9745317.1 HAD family hydrolase [Diplocloster agilis]MCU6735428.1 HAD family hydrolase [Suonthocola fibrivorans]SCJ73641.1 Phosphoglycolate phosphatase [uncultured Clostridium sp.]